AVDPNCVCKAYHGPGVVNQDGGLTGSTRAAGPPNASGWRASSTIVGSESAPTDHGRIDRNPMELLARGRWAHTPRSPGTPREVISGLSDVPAEPLHHHAPTFTGGAIIIVDLKSHRGVWRVGELGSCGRAEDDDLSLKTVIDRKDLRLL